MAILLFIDLLQHPQSGISDHELVKCCLSSSTFVLIWDFKNVITIKFFTLRKKFTINVYAAHLNLILNFLQDILLIYTLDAIIYDGV